MSIDRPFPGGLFSDDHPGEAVAETDDWHAVDDAAPDGPEAWRSGRAARRLRGCSRGWGRPPQSGLRGLVEGFVKQGSSRRRGAVSAAARPSLQPVAQRHQFIDLRDHAALFGNGRWAKINFGRIDWPSRGRLT